MRVNLLPAYVLVEIISMTMLVVEWRRRATSREAGVAIIGVTPRNAAISGDIRAHIVPEAADAI